MAVCLYIACVYMCNHTSTRVSNCTLSVCVCRVQLCLRDTRAGDAVEDALKAVISLSGLDHLGSTRPGRRGDVDQ